MRFKIYFLIVLLLLTFVSCKQKTNAFFEQNKSIANNTWDYKNWQEFEFEVNDTVNLYDFYFNLRTTANYEYSNLFIFYNLYFPNGKGLTDTAEFILAQPNGKWLGNSATGSIIENSILFSRKKRFPLIGKYKFKVVQGMRNKQLKNISDIGLKIVKTKND